MNKRIRFSHTIENLPQAMSVYFNQLLYQMRIYGRDVTALSLGEAFFSIPRFDFGELDFDRGYHYSESLGVPALRKKITDYYRDEYQVNVNWSEQILISSGSKIILFMCMKAFLNPGDKIALHEPAWLSYSEQAKLCEASTIFIPHDIRIDNFGEYLTKNTKILIINNPNNPAGKIYSEKEIRRLSEICNERNIVLIVDEAYSEFVGSKNFTSVGKVCKKLENVIIVNSLSKNMGMSGWRIGYLISCPEIVEKILKINQHLITCAPTILQLYTARYFKDILEITRPQISTLMQKREQIRELIFNLGFEVLEGSGTFYFFIDLRSLGYSGDAFIFALHLLLNHDISVVPGSAYGNSTDNYIRISIGTESIDRINEALKVIKSEAKKTLDASAVNLELKRLSLPLFKMEH